MSPARIAGRIVALLLIFFYVALAPAMLLAFDTQQVVIEGRFLEAATADVRIFDQVLIAMADGLAKDDRPAGSPLALVDAQGWEKILRVVAPPEFMQRWAQAGVTKFRAWLQGGGTALMDIMLPFGDMRANLINDPAHTALGVIIDAQPECAQDQAPLAAQDDLLPRCRPASSDARGTLEQRLASTWSERPQEAWKALWGAGVGDHPDNVSIVDYNPSRARVDRAGTLADMEITRNFLTLSRWFVLGLILAMTVVILALVMLFAARNLAEALRWAGVPLALAGIVTLFLGLFVRLMQSVGAFVVSPATVARYDADVWAGAFVRPFAADLWPVVAMHGGILLAIGVTQFVVSFFVPRRQPAPAPAPQMLR